MTDKFGGEEGFDSTPTEALVEAIKLYRSSNAHNDTLKQEAAQPESASQYFRKIISDAATAPSQPTTSMSNSTIMNSSEGIKLQGCYLNVVIPPYYVRKQ